MRLFIAEKPSLALKIATALGVARKEQGYIECRNGDVVTFQFGHLLEQAGPEQYGDQYKYWTLAHLPIVPPIDGWKLFPKDTSSKAQLKVIGGLIPRADVVVNAGDADYEGQLLIDETLDYLRCRKPVLRLWLNSLEAPEINKAIAKMRPNLEYRGWREAAEARRKGDWLVGMNFTRAATVIGRNAGYQGVISIGRVQTPTLALVVTRDREIANFVPHDYFVTWGVLNDANGDFRATWVVPDEVMVAGGRRIACPKDDEGRLLDGKIAHAVAAAAKDKTGTVMSCETRQETRHPPLPYSLSGLQKEASAKYGFSAKETVDTAQTLYERELITYPRTDCSHLPEDQHGDAPRILKALEGMGFEAAKGANPSLKSPAWNSKKVAESSHYALMPTGRQGEMSESERQLFGLIASAYIRQFYPPLIAQVRTALIKLIGLDWKATGHQVVNPGWTLVSKPDHEDQDNRVPAMKAGDQVRCSDADNDSKKTTPPNHFTEGTLIDAMKRIGDFIKDATAEQKKLLKENQGIGTEATRAQIIENLIQRGFVVHKGKYLLSTGTGLSVIANVPKALSDPLTTAVWEGERETLRTSGREHRDFVQNLTENFVGPLLKELAGSKMADLGALSTVCPACGSRAFQRTSSKSGRAYWRCSANGDHLFGDINGQPGNPFPPRQPGQTPSHPAPRTQPVKQPRKRSRRGFRRSEKP